MVCSNLGPAIASLRGAWLRLQIPLDLFGAWVTLISSASTTPSLNGSAMFPSESDGVSLVLETLGVGVFGFGSLAWMRFSPVERRDDEVKVARGTKEVARLRSRRRDAVESMIDVCVC